MSESRDHAVPIVRDLERHMIAHRLDAPVGEVAHRYVPFEKMRAYTPCALVTNRIRELREARDMTQAQLADRVEVARQTIIAVEKGRYDPSLSLAFRIADAFGLTVDEVFRGSRR